VSKIISLLILGSTVFWIKKEQKVGKNVKLDRRISEKINFLTKKNRRSSPRCWESQPDFVLETLNSDFYILASLNLLEIVSTIEWFADVSLNRRKTVLAVEFLLLDRVLRTDLEKKVWYSLQISCNRIFLGVMTEKSIVEYWFIKTHTRVFIQKTMAWLKPKRNLKWN